MFDRFTDDARRSMNLARAAALRFRHGYIGTEHMLLGVTGDESFGAVRVLRRLGVEPQAVRAEVEKIVRNGISEWKGQLPFTPRMKRVLEFAVDEAESRRDDGISTEHLLLGLSRDNRRFVERFLGWQHQFRGVAWHVLSHLGVTYRRARAATAA